MLAWEGTTGYDSNVFNTDNNEKSDTLIRTGPDVSLRKLQGDWTFDLEGRVRYEQFPSKEDDGSFDYFSGAQTRWAISPRTALSASHRFIRVKSVARGLDAEDQVDAAPVGEARLDRRGVDRHLFELSLSHQLDRTWSLQGFANGQVTNFDRETSFDGYSLRGGVQVTKVLSPRHTVGVGASVTVQDFDDAREVKGRETRFYQGFATWDFAITRTLRLRFQGGPTWVDPDSSNNQSALQFPVGEFQSGGTTPLPVYIDPDSDCLVVLPGAGSPACDPAEYREIATGNVRPEPLPAINNRLVGLGFDDNKEADGSLTFFGRISLDRDWEAARASLSYERRSSAASGFGTSTDVDLVVGRADWTPSRKWRLLFRGSWSRQVSSSEVRQRILVNSGSTDLFFDQLGRIVDPGSPDAFWTATVAESTSLTSTSTTNNAIDLTTYRMETQLRRRVTEQSYAFTRVLWLRQESDGDLSRRGNVHDLRIEFGFRWEFEAIKL